MARVRVASDLHLLPFRTPPPTAEFNAESAECSISVTRAATDAWFSNL